MYSIARQAGRLVEIRIWSPVSLAEAERWGAEHDAVVEVVEAYVRVMRGEERLLRTGTLLGPSPTQGLQERARLRALLAPRSEQYRAATGEGTIRG